MTEVYGRYQEESAPLLGTLRETGHQVWIAGFVNRYNYVIHSLMVPVEHCVSRQAVPHWPIRMFFPHNHWLGFVVNMLLSLALIFHFMCNMAFSLQCYYLWTHTETSDKHYVLPNTVQTKAWLGAFSFGGLLITTYMLVVVVINIRRMARIPLVDVLNIHLETDATINGFINQFVALDVLKRESMQLLAVQRLKSLYAMAQRYSLSTLHLHLFGNKWNRYRLVYAKTGVYFVVLWLFNVLMAITYLIFVISDA